jgi:glycosyltransferase involved in cell wall biosynthesis
MELLRLGHEVCVVSLFDSSEPSIEAELKVAGATVRTLGKRRGLDLRMLPRLVSAVSAFNPAVIHTHLYVLKYLLPGLSAAGAVPIVHTVHNLACREGTWGDLLVQQFAFRRGVAAVAIGQAVARSMQRVYRLPPRRTIPNGIALNDYAPPPGAREELRAALGIPADAPTFVSVGRLEAQKNHATLLEAFANRRFRMLGSHLLLAGDGELRGALESRARDLGIAACVHFLGARKDVPRVLAAADVFVLASTYEGHPLSVMEAMAAGKPVVATEVGCVPENVSPSTGRLVAPGDADGLARAMLELGCNLDLARSLGVSASQLARAQFDACAMTHAYVRLYGELLSRSPGTAGQ